MSINLKCNITAYPDLTLTLIMDPKYNITAYAVLKLNKSMAQK